MLDAFLREQTRPSRESDPDVLVWRRATVTEVDAAAKRIRTSLTGEAWLRYPLWWTPTADDVDETTVEVLQQGPAQWVVFTVLAP